MTIIPVNDQDHIIVYKVYGDPGEKLESHLKHKSSAQVRCVTVGVEQTRLVK